MVFEIELVIFAKMDYMNDTATINSKGQIFIPTELFKLGKFVKGQSVDMVWSEGSLKVFCNTKAIDLVDLGGLWNQRKI